MVISRIFINFEEMCRKYGLILLLSLLASACSNKYHAFISKYTFHAETGRPDYSNPDHWAAHPWKWDPSDSVPRPLRDGYHPDTSVDVFFIHPTTYVDKQKSFGWNAPVDDPELCAKTDYSTILFQASIFNEAGRVFAPRYRQANYYAYLPKTKQDTLHALEAFDTAYEDVKTAFLYYLQHYNNGRPIIIASHSQGATHGKRLISEFFDGKPLQQQLVAAYLIGMPLEPGLFTHVKPCSSPTETSCAISWRTLKNGFTPDYIAKEDFVSIVTNPLSWDARQPVAGRDMNKGGILTHFNKIIQRVADAHIDGGVLRTAKPHFFGNIFLNFKNYHIADLNLYYLSIRENVKQRVEAYKKR